MQRVQGLPGVLGVVGDRAGDVRVVLVRDHQRALLDGQPVPPEVHHVDPAAPGERHQVSGNLCPDAHAQFVIQQPDQFGDGHLDHGRRAPCRPAVLVRADRSQQLHLGQCGLDRRHPTIVEVPGQRPVVAIGGTVARLGRVVHSPVLGTQQAKVAHQPADPIGRRQRGQFGEQPGQLHRDGARLGIQQLTQLRGATGRRACGQPVQEFLVDPHGIVGPVQQRVLLRGRIGCRAGRQQRFVHLPVHGT
ncbi:hypothetical protein GCM10023321_70090 [Pseudonocardia eucalypti]|uniref:Uncharacterized protein n=1 Tax=Pseudonocardia eucalypti TaxID=648755 RepID=A0ABP9R4N9_9PSEU